MYLQADSVPGNSKKALQQIERRNAAKNSLKVSENSPEANNLYSKSTPHSPRLVSAHQPHELDSGNDNDTDICTTGIIETEAEADYEDPVDDEIDNDTDLELKHQGSSPTLRDKKEKYHSHKHLSIWNRVRYAQDSVENQPKSMADEDRRNTLGRQVLTETDEGSIFELSDEVGNDEEMPIRFQFRSSSSLETKS